MTNNTRWLTGAGIRNNTRWIMASDGLFLNVVWGIINAWSILCDEYSYGVLPDAFVRRNIGVETFRHLWRIFQTSQGDGLFYTCFISSLPFQKERKGKGVCNIFPNKSIAAEYSEALMENNNNTIRCVYFSWLSTEPTLTNGYLFNFDYPLPFLFPLVTFTTKPHH